MKISSYSVTKSEQLNSLFINAYETTSLAIKNNSPFLLTLDILRNEVKQDLLQIVILVIEETFLKLSKEKKIEIKDNTFLLLIKKSFRKFFKKYYGTLVIVDSFVLDNALLHIGGVGKEDKYLLEVLYSTLTCDQPRAFNKMFNPIYKKPTTDILNILLSNLISKLVNL